MKKWLVGLALCLSSGAIAQAGLLEVSHNRLFVSATVNGEPARALLDSGAEMSVMDDGLAGQLRLEHTGAALARGTGGTAPVRFADGVSIGAAGRSLTNLKVAILDLDDVGSRLLGRPIDLIIGREYFDTGRISIDIEAGLISPISRHQVPRGAALELETRKGVETIAVSVEGHEPVRADFDLGNGSEVLIGRAYAQRIGLLAAGRKTGSRSGGGIGGPIERDLVVLKSLTVAGLTFRNVEAAIDPAEGSADLNIGTRILRHFRITTDFPQRKLWLEPRADRR